MSSASDAYHHKDAEKPRQKALSVNDTPANHPFPEIASTANPPIDSHTFTPQVVMQLQRTIGNRAVQRLMDTSPTEAGLAASTIQRQPFQDVDVAFDVPLVPQPTRVSCWAAALAMVIGNRDSTSYPVQHVASEAGMNLTTGYGWSNIQNAVSHWGLSQTAPASAEPPYWADLLSSHGPLWIVEVGAPYHAVVLTAMHGTGDVSATEVHLNNPWPPNQGRVEYKTFEDFDNDFGLGAGAGAMIVHA